MLTFYEGVRYSLEYMNEQTPKHTIRKHNLSQCRFYLQGGEGNLFTVKL